jgi:hypothetical protein
LKLALLERPDYFFFFAAAFFFAGAFFLVAFFIELILPLHRITRYSFREHGCVPFIRLFEMKVKRKMHEACRERERDSRHDARCARKNIIV